MIICKADPFQHRSVVEFMKLKVGPWLHFGLGRKGKGCRYIWLYTVTFPILTTAFEAFVKYRAVSIAGRRDLFIYYHFSVRFTSLLPVVVASQDNYSTLGAHCT